MAEASNNGGQRLTSFGHHEVQHEVQHEFQHEKRGKEEGNLVHQADAKENAPALEIISL